MAKSARASSRKANNLRLKKNVFGPVEAARAERLAAKLKAIVEQEKPSREADINMIEVGEDGGRTTAGETQDVEAVGDSKMEVDAASGSSAAKSKASGRIQKKRRVKSKIVFPKYQDRKARRKA
ncbi:hypothetical protein ACRALDRAFT_1076277 [Sodiomyces alcalophilus JCM 7366]|uniref:uncharacterized protein n=1 Tax=Sodiomyces alcalophilus JCM 7366 TaxID=591952 RepID=UPI0039B66AAD